MQKLTEETILSPFIGKTINRSVFDSLVWSVYQQQYTLRNCEYMDDPRLCEQFDITERLRKLWYYNGINLNLTLFFDEDLILAAYIYKYREGAGGHGRPIIRELTPSQQELRVVRSIMQYLTT